MTIHVCQTQDEFNKYFSLFQNLGATDQIEFKEQNNELIPLIRKKSSESGFLSFLEHHGIWKPKSSRLSFVKEMTIAFFQKNAHFLPVHAQSEVINLRDRIKTKLHFNDNSSWNQTIDSATQKIALHYTPNQKEADFKPVNESKLTIICIDGELNTNLELFKNSKVIKDLLLEEDGDQTLNLKDFLTSTIELFLKASQYPDSELFIEQKEIFELYRLANFLNHDQLIKDCDQALCIHIKKHPHFHYLNILFEPGNEGLVASRNRAVKYTAKKFKTFINDVESKLLKPEILIEILKNAALAGSEDVIFNFVYKWAEEVVRADNSLTIEQILNKKIEGQSPLTLIRRLLLNKENQERYNHLIDVKEIGTQRVLSRDPSSKKIVLNIAGFRESIKDFNASTPSEIFYESPPFLYKGKNFSIISGWDQSTNTICIYLKPNDLTEEITMKGLFILKTGSSKFKTNFFKGGVSHNIGFEISKEDYEPLLQENGDFLFSIEIR